MNPYECALAMHRLLQEKFGDPSWRTPLPALDELISTILSQNTNDTNRDRAFSVMRSRFPTWELVRDAEEQAVIESIRSAGLANQKGPRIQKILRDITLQRGSLDLDFLKDMTSDEARDWLIQFKGVGPKTAAIVLLFSLGKPAFPVDTHIYRVTGRVGLRPERMSIEQTHTYLAELFPSDAYQVVHLNIIKLGREVCHPRRPACEICVLQSLCDYYQRRQRDGGYA